MAARSGITRAVIGVAAAQALFAATFRGPRERFWPRMTLTGLTLGSYALAVAKEPRATHIGVREAALGLASAAALYGTFQAGDRFARRFVPSGADDIAEIYALREAAPKEEIALRLATVIGPAEELFWRGLVQSALMRRFGRWRGAAMGAAAYGGVHIVTGNFTLFGAAGVAGAFWSTMYAAGAPMGVLIASHVSWDIWIFLLAPTDASPRR